MFGIIFHKFLDTFKNLSLRFSARTNLQFRIKFCTFRTGNMKECAICITPTSVTNTIAKLS